MSTVQFHQALKAINYLIITQSFSKGPFYDDSNNDWEEYQCRCSKCQSNNSQLSITACELAQRVSIVSISLQMLLADQWSSHSCNSHFWASEPEKFLSDRTKKINPIMLTLIKNSFLLTCYLCIARNTNDKIALLCSPKNHQFFWFNENPRNTFINSNWKQKLIFFSVATN